MEKMKMHSPNLTQDNVARIRELFPNCVTEAQGEDGTVKLAVDFDQLRQELAESIVEGPQERYHLNWPGKREALLTANAPIAKTLRPCREESVDFDTTKNLFIEGDNLDALKLLQETYLGKVKMIYIDPPYNTGNDFIYVDDFSEDTESFLLRSNQKDEVGNRLIANTIANGRFHSDWLSMMYPRLKLARNLLRDDGLIFISIDNTELDNLRRVCNEIFGEDNFVEMFTWHKKNSAKGVPPKNMVVNIHEYVLCYSKNQNAKVSGEKRTEDTFANPDNDARGLWRRSNIKSTLERPKDKFTITDPKTGNDFINYWAFSEETLKRMIDEDRILFPKELDGLPKQKEFLSEFANPNMPIKSHLGLFHSQDTTEKEVESMMGSKLFLYRKPIELVKTIVEQGSTGNEEIVLDFFAGSATTAHAVMRMNSEDNGKRKFILVQIPEVCAEDQEAFKAGFKNIAEISKERIRRAGQMVKKGTSGQSLEAAPSLDIGFRVLKVDASNMADVYYAPDALDKAKFDLFVDNIKTGRTPEDLLFQVMLDWGIDLALPITKQSIQGKDVFFVDGNVLVSCFDASGSIDEAFVKELAKQQPLRVVFRDAGYKDSAVKINVEQIFKLLSPATEVKCI